MHAKMNRMGAMVLALCLGASFATLGWTDDDDWGRMGEYEEGESEHEGGFWRRSADLPVPPNRLYRSECGSCHFAYPPGMLPERSWSRIMASLNRHFGDDASLEPDEREAIERFLRGHAADRLPNRFSRSILRSIGDDAPLRFTGTAFFRRAHHEIPPRMVTGNPKVGSFANCTACHTGAERGFFNEDSVRIPGYGRWED